MDKMIFVGKNYLDHAKELGDAVPELPVLFFKPPSVAVNATRMDETLRVRLPEGPNSVHYETEIVIRLNQGGSGWSSAEAQAAIEAVTLGLDMTLREVQARLKKEGHPWEISKCFPGSAIVGPWIRTQDFPNYLDTEFSFTLDGTQKQSARGTQMRLSPADCVAYASRHFPLCAGDILFTGTPAGVGAVRNGQLGKLSWDQRLNYQVEWL